MNRVMYFPVRSIETVIDVMIKWYEVTKFIKSEKYLLALI